MIDLRTTKMETLEQKLSKEFEPSEIEWKVDETTVEPDDNGNNVGKARPYANNRAIQKRLDEIFTPFGWENEFKEWKGHSQLCGITVRVMNETGQVDKITKWDGSQDTAFEGVKGGLSDSMKRCAVQWGIGRYLYKVIPPYVQVENIGRGGYVVKRGQEQVLLNALLGKKPSEPAEEPINTKPVGFIPATEKQKGMLKNNLAKLPITEEQLDNDEISKEQASKLIDSLTKKTTKKVETEQGGKAKAGAEQGAKKEKTEEPKSDDKSKTGSKNQASELPAEQIIFAGEDDDLEPAVNDNAEKADPALISWIRKTQLRGLVNKIPEGEGYRSGTAEEVEQLVCKAFRIKSLDEATKGLANEIISYNRKVLNRTVRLGEIEAA